MMDCWNFSINYLLQIKDIPYQESNFIFSEVFEWVSLLSKIGIVLLDYYKEVSIIHEHEEIFINLTEDEIPLMNEYIKWLDDFQKKWWKYSNREISLDFLEENLKDNYCIIPIKKWEWSHLVILKEMKNDDVILIDNKKWEYSISKDEFNDLISLYNWKYVLFVNKLF